MPKKEFLFPLVLFCMTIWLTVNNEYGGAFLCFFLMFGMIFIMALNKKYLEDDEREEISSRTASLSGQPVCHVYYGDELHFTSSELDVMLRKRIGYYSNLSPGLKTRFLARLQKFISSKTFKIHSDTPYKEMPVLIGAAAVQLTFGLETFRLPNFEFIHVYPQEFMRIDQHISFLEGNVRGRTINLSWKHFLDGYAIPDDGQNVGLHELAHALYYQTFVVEENVDEQFRERYSDYTNDANKAFHTEATTAGGLYSDYAVRNYQEFWAESVELFFERPADLERDYPELYENLKRLLNQDPAKGIAVLDY